MVSIDSAHGLAIKASGVANPVFLAWAARCLRCVSVSSEGMEFKVFSTSVLTLSTEANKEL